jgi:hypothetical protein
MSSDLHILFPSDYFDKRRIDAEYLNEYNIASSLGFKCHLFNYDEFIGGESLKLNGASVSGEMTVALYRGWMISVNKYNYLYDELRKHYNIVLLNSPENYNECYHFDNAYKHLIEYTPKILMVNNIFNFNVSILKEHFYDYFMMKDNVKSVKGEKFPNKIPVTISNSEFDALALDFITKRGTLYTGQIMLKQFVELKKYDNTTNEWRAFYFYGKLLTINRNSNQKFSAKSPSIELLNIEESTNLKSLFYTIDFAETSDGTWIVIETGDGGVSGLSPLQNILEFYSKILNIWNEIYKSTL